MSISDEDFISKMIEKSERFITSEIAKVQNQVRTLIEKEKIDSAKIEELQAENNRLNEKVERLENQLVNLEQEVHLPKDFQQSSMLTVMENAFRAGLHSVMGASASMDSMHALAQSLSEPTATANVLCV